MARRFDTSLRVACLLWQRNHHQLVLPAIISLMDPHQPLRIQAYAAGSTVNFCDDVAEATMAPYLDTLLTALLQLLHSPSHAVVISAVPAISQVLPPVAFG